MENNKTVKTDPTDLTGGPVYRRIILYTLPIILTSVLQLLFNAADLVVVGRFRGSVSLAAVGSTGAITNLIVNFFIGLSLGTGVSTAHAIGAKDEKMAHQVVHTALPTALISGMILVVVGVTMAARFLTWMGTPEEVLPLSSVYMRIYFCGMPFSMVYNYCSAILRAAGDTRHPLIFLTLAGIINVIFNVLFVAVFGMGVEGVALATVISQGISATLVVRELTRRQDMIRLDLKKLRIYPRALGKIARLGLPAGLNGSLYSISNVLIQSSINSLGKVVMSGNAAAGNIDGFVYVIQNAFAVAALNFVGQAIGAGKLDRVRKVYRAALLCAATAGILSGTAAYVFGRSLLGIYITDSPEAIGYGLVSLSIIALPYWLCVLMDVTSSTLRGMGRSFAPMIIAIIGICGFRILWIAFVFPLPDFHNLYWLKASYPISWVLTFIGQYIAFRLAFKQAEKTMAPKEQ